MSGQQGRWKEIVATIAAVSTIAALAFVIYDHIHKQPGTDAAGGDDSAATTSTPTPQETTSSTPETPQSSGESVAVPTYLTDLGAIDASVFNTDVLPANGKEYAHSFYLDPDCGNGGGTHEPPIQQVAFDLKRAYGTLTGSVAESDDSRRVSRYQIDIYGDGKNLYSQRLRYGQTLNLEIAVKSVLNLEVRATLLTGSDEQCFFQGKVVYGDFKVE